MGGTFSKIGDFASGASDAVAGTGQSVGDLKDIGYSAGDIANLGGGEMSAGQKIAKGLTGAIGGGLKNLPSQQQPRAGQPSPIQVTQAPDVSGFYPVKPIMPATNPNDPYSAFYRR